MKGSIWLEEPAPSFGRLDGDVSADVAVIGGGIVGVTAAWLLQEAGARVVLIDANRVGHGVTGHTTAKVSSQHGLIYAQLRDQHGPQAAAAYGGANEAALEWVAAHAGEHSDFRRRASYAYVTSDSERQKVIDETRAAAGAGLPATLVSEVPLPLPVAAAVRFDDQAEFHPLKYLYGLVRDLPEVYEHTHAIQVGEFVRTPGGNISAEHTIVATHFPFPDRSLAFARAHPMRSYAIVCDIEGELPDGIFISGDSPTRSVRVVDDKLLVGGEGHRTGTGGDTEERYAALEAFAREHWRVRSVDHRWSSQDNVTIDGLPFVGHMTPFEERVLMATGFAKWGMTGGTAAAQLLADLVLGRENPYAALFDPNRFNVRVGGPRLIKDNAVTGARFVADRVRHRGRRPLESLAPGEGDIVRHNGERVAGYRDPEGKLYAVSPVCTHLGCQVNFNTAETSWDCPCHGSRYAVDGTVLQGPAVHRLETKPLSD
ncbi:FAD-dependent oxidoreductase [Solirubrobacter sp. CPCC 204708]|uniref:FAD-dependent oxidoreductase n=1 Tax=Solirubrobacter deserti TaxID=2282478 RepID=A0ABT4RDC2_9ACTN|nr:FAD-dependent oxidoreductase [Solirubrobacter deserti]MBE2314529.1 FAD-dependent oxidoreductase [Solirubrobacter deserti]MDA0136533.1 FAD-dependent oxidoreductase [Solirubrobacter deserti]